MKPSDLGDMQLYTNAVYISGGPTTHMARPMGRHYLQLKCMIGEGTLKVISNYLLGTESRDGTRGKHCERCFQ